MKDHPSEQWKAVTFNFEFTNDFRLEVSNYGRLRSFNKVSNGNILNGTMVNGYRIVRLKFYKQRSTASQNKLDFLQQQVFSLARELRSLKKNNAFKKTIEETEKLLVNVKKNLSKKFHQDLKERTINYHALIHRLVAEYFLDKPTAQQTKVAHLDHEKLNNHVSNVKWMTPEENFAHQQTSPNVIKDKQERRYRRKESAKSTKLTVTKVMLLKKLINQGKPMKQLTKHFKITDTQILRIKRGENWADIPAAT